MGSKRKIKEGSKKEGKPNFLDIHWNKIIIGLLFLIPFCYFAQFLSARALIAGSDYLIGGYPFEKWSTEQKEIPLWYPHVFGGIPVLGQPVGGHFAPLTLLGGIITPQVGLALKFIIVFFLAGLGMYLYLKDLGISPYTAAVGAFAYQFIGNLATMPEAGHAGRATSIATFSLMLFFLHHGLRTKKFRDFVLMGLTTVFAFYEGHFQITYYGLLFILGYVIYYLISHRQEFSKKALIRVIGYGLCSIFLICLLMAMIWLPVLTGLKTAARGVERGYEYATSWAMPVAELIDLIVPSFSGILENYWGANQFKQHLEYFGLVVLIFAIFAILFYWQRPYIKFFTISIAVVVLIAIGRATPFFKIPYLLVPGFRLFRAPALSFFLASFSFVVLAAFSLENVVIKKELGLRKFLTAAGIILGSLILLLFLLAPAIGQEIAGRNLAQYEKNFSNYLEGAWLSLFFIIIVFAVFYILLRQKTRPPAISLWTILIVLTNQLPLVSKFLPKTGAPERYYAEDEVVKFLKRDNTIFRVFPLEYRHARDSYLLYHGIHSAGGYIPNPIQRYQEFIGAGTSVMFNPAALIQYPRLADMLSLKYIIAPNLPDDLTSYSSEIQGYVRLLKEYLAPYKPVFRGYEHSVYLNQNALPRAYIVPHYQVVQENEVLEVMKSISYEPKQVVILEEDPHIPAPKEPYPMVEAKIVAYTPNRIVCETDCAQPGFLVLTDNWHPDWKVYVDAKPARLFRANYIFRAVYLEPGRHEVIFAYESKSFKVGKIITIVTCLLTTIFFISSAITSYKRPKRT